MPKMQIEGKQVKVWLPEQLYAMLCTEAEETGRPMAEIVREGMAERYRSLFSVNIANATIIQPLKTSGAT